MDENSKENTDTNAKQGEEQGSENKTENNSEPNEKTGSDENTDSDVEQDAFDFVDLVFTGQDSTSKQNINFDNLVKKLKNNKIALKYIDLDIQNLIYSVAIGNNKKLNKIFDKCYDALETLETFDKLDPQHKLDLESVIEKNLPRYLKKLKGLTDSESKELYDNVVTSYKWYYGVITKKGDLVNIRERVDDLEQRVENNSINAKKNITEAENNIKKELYPEFITLLGIFTAITFAIFGGMNLLSNLFQNMRSTHASLGQALILASIFGFTMLGIIEILFIWISEINLTKVDRDYRNDRKEDDANEESSKEYKIYESKKKLEKIALTSLALTLLVGLALFFF